MRFKDKIQDGQGGQTLIEVLLAFSIAILILGAIIVVVASSLNSSTYTKNQSLANSYAQEGMAVIRQIRDSSWNKFSQYAENTEYCLGPDSIEPEELTPPDRNCWTRSPVPAGGIFSREVVFDHNSDSCCSNSSPICEDGTRGSRAAVKVSWSDNRCPAGENNPLCHNVELVTCFSNLDQKEAP